MSPVPRSLTRVASRSESGEKRHWVMAARLRVIRSPSGSSVRASRITSSPHCIPTARCRPGGHRNQTAIGHGSGKVFGYGDGYWTEAVMGHGWVGRNVTLVVR